MNVTRIIGIDAGLSGGIAVLRRDSIVSRVWAAQVCVMPVRLILGPPRRGAKRKHVHDYSIGAIFYMLRNIRDAATMAGGTAVICLERVDAMPSRPKMGPDGKLGSYFRGSIGTAKLMRGYGILLGISKCTLPEAQVTEVHQSSWQSKVYGALKTRDTKNTKLAAAEACGILYPEVSLLATPKSRSPHDGMADALMIAEYMRRRLYAEEG